ncbi:MAG: sulfate adenylyltransferase [Chloroflexota bacterium]
MGVSLVTTAEHDTVLFGSEPHGGVLVDRFVEGEAAAELQAAAASLQTIELSERDLSDVEMIAIGGYSPLTGFMTREDYEPVVETMRLANGLPWTIPITLSLEPEQAATIETGDRVVLSAGGRKFAVMDVEDKFTRDKHREAIQVFGVDEMEHPGVAALYAESDTLIGGPIQLFGPLPDLPFPEFRFTPAQTRQIFAERGWRTIVGFQTRNPVHRAHEYLQKCALEIVDGLLLHPLVGATKSDDVPADVRMRSYQALLAEYYPADRVQLAVNPAAMRYGGPREAVFHCLIRKNFGCTHFVVGRDHAGVGGYYGPYDAQHIFSNFEPSELGIQPLFFEHAFFCTACGNMATAKSCPHGAEDHVILSGTQVRKMLREGQMPPPTFSRPPVAQILIEAMRNQS